MENYKPHIIGNVIFESIYSIETYPESDNLQFDIILSRLKKEFPDTRICYAKHDHDVKEDGSPVKTHFEILFKFPQIKSINVIAAGLQVPVTAINWRKNWVKSVRYLAHLDQPDKYQYPIETVICEDRRDYKYLRLEEVDKETDHISLIFDFIDSHSHYSMKDLQDFALQNGVWSTFRRNYSIFKDR